MDTAHIRTPAVEFALRSAVGSLGLFGLLRLNWIEAHAVLPFTQAQARLATQIFGASALPIEATLACSGADALALCLGVVFAYPVTWQSRLAGAAAGLSLILTLNTMRIGTLGLAAGSPLWFGLLHLYVWPAVLTVAIVAYVLAWMRLADRREAPSYSAHVNRELAISTVPRPSRRFIVPAIAFTVVFAAAASFYLESAAVLAVAALIARLAAAALNALGMTAAAAANVLQTPRGAFLVTQECISTPLIPLYLAAVCAYATTWRRAIAGIAATLPVFTFLGVARLLVVALPEAVMASPLFLIHAFYQLLLGALIVYLAARWGHGNNPRGLAHAVGGVTAGIIVLNFAGPPYTHALAYFATLPLEDPQGALAFLPAFQLSLYIALGVAALAASGWPRFAAGLAVLAVTQVAGLNVLGALTRHAAMAAQVPGIRAWAVVAPVLIFTAVTHVGWARR